MSLCVNSGEFGEPAIISQYDNVAKCQCLPNEK